MLYSVAANNFESVPLIIGEYKNKVSEENIDYLTVAGAYADIGAYDKAEDMLVRINTKSLEDNNKTLKYYTTLIRIYRHKGDYRKVYESYLKFNELNDSILFSIFESDTQFIEERHALEMQKAKETEAKNRLTIIVLACVIALMSSLYILNFIRKRLKETKQKNIQLENEKAHYEKMYLEVLSERKALNDMISNSASRMRRWRLSKRDSVYLILSSYPICPKRVRMSSVQMKNWRSSLPIETTLSNRHVLPWKRTIRTSSPIFMTRDWKSSRLTSAVSTPLA